MQHYTRTSPKAQPGAPARRCPASTRPACGLGATSRATKAKGSIRRASCRRGPYWADSEFAGLERAIGLFQGVIIEHELQVDGSASIDLRYYVVEPDSQSPLGHTQKRDITAGLSMGADSGMDEVESVALGPEYELAFLCHRVA
jgi:hypothetical protein